MQSNVIIYAALIIILIAIVFSIQGLRRKFQAVERTKQLIIPKKLPSEGVDVPILEGMLGPKRFGVVVLWHNNFAPKLILFEDHIEYRSFRLKSARYDEIEEVVSFRSKFYNRMRISFTNSSTSFTAVFTETDLMDRVMEFLATKGILPETGGKF